MVFVISEIVAVAKIIVGILAMNVGIKVWLKKEMKVVVSSVIWLFLLWVGILFFELVRTGYFEIWQSINVIPYLWVLGVVNIYFVLIHRQKEKTFISLYKHIPIRDWRIGVGLNHSYVFIGAI